MYSTEYSPDIHIHPQLLLAPNKELGGGGA